MFNKNNSAWLETVFNLPLNNIPTNIEQKKTGRPLKEFSECSERTKRQKVLPLVKSYSSPELVLALSTKFQKSGQRSASLLLNDSLTSPTRAIKIRNVVNNVDHNKIIPYTANEALAFLIDNKLTKQQYLNIRLGAKKKNCDIYPPYSSILEAKKKCYPDDLHISESNCSVPMQSLVDHTVHRIFEIETVKSMQIKENMNHFEMLYKWGCDGSSGQAQYKQNFNDGATSLITDHDLFMFSIVPIQLRCLIQEKYIVVWQNPRTSSTRFCRPIKFSFEKETVNSTLREVNASETEIKNLLPTKILLDKITLEIKHTLIFSMVDGKVKFTIINLTILNV